MDVFLNRLRAATDFQNTNAAAIKASLIRAKTGIKGFDDLIEKLPFTTDTNGLVHVGLYYIGGFDVAVRCGNLKKLYTIHDYPITYNVSDDIEFSRYMIKHQRLYWTENMIYEISKEYKANYPRLDDQVNQNNLTDVIKMEQYAIQQTEGKTAYMFLGKTEMKEDWINANLKSRAGPHYSEIKNGAMRSFYARYLDCTNNPPKYLDIMPEKNIAPLNLFNITVAYIDALDGGLDAKTRQALEGAINMSLEDANKDAKNVLINKFQLIRNALLPYRGKPLNPCVIHYDIENGNNLDRMCSARGSAESTTYIAAAYYPKNALITQNRQVSVADVMADFYVTQGIDLAVVLDNYKETTKLDSTVPINTAYPESGGNMAIFWIIGLLVLIIIVVGIFVAQRTLKRKTPQQDPLKQNIAT